MGLMMLAAEQGSKLQMTLEGDDAQQAFSAIEKIEDKDTEDHRGEGRIFFDREKGVVIE